jgi:hypothetical protein
MVRPRAIMYCDIKDDVEGSSRLKFGGVLDDKIWEADWA